MITRILVLLALAVVSIGSSFAEENPPALVSTAWLAEHMNDPGLVILHTAQLRRDYNSGHIPGARFLWVGSMALSNPDLSFQLLPIEHLDTTLEALGITNHSRIVLCGVNGNVSPTARVFITLEYLGFTGRVGILDGGFEAWKAEGRPVSTESPKVARSKFTPNVREEVFAQADWINANLTRKGIRIIDARAPGFYAGTMPNGMPRSGHIPGSANIYFSTLVDSTNKMLPKEKIREMFTSAGVNEGDRVVPYCHIGQTASLVYFAARYLGHNASLYDGSFEEWSGRMDLPVELPAKTDSTK